MAKLRFWFLVAGKNTCVEIPKSSKLALLLLEVSFKINQMQEFVEKYINPFTDYGFKKLFGEEPNKDLLLDFLNELLKEEQGTITKLKYLKSERLGQNFERKAIFDLYCTNEKGEKFIVEIQKAKHKFFKERSVFYSTFPIREQAKKSEWDYNLNAVYTIAILDFVFDKDKEDLEKYRYDVKPCDIETCKVFYDKLTFIYLEMPKFRKSLDELETRFDKWLYILANLHKLERIPEKLQESIFERLFEVAEIAKFDTQQFNEYEGSLKVYRDLKGTFDTARDESKQEGLEEGLVIGRKEGMREGMEKGMEKGIEKVALNLLSQDFTDKDIMRLTGMTKNQLDSLKGKFKDGNR